MNKFGFDLDNTIIDYSEAVLEYCKLVNVKGAKDLSNLRKLLKRSENDQESWIEAQSWIYSEGLRYAKISSGLIELCSVLKERGFELRIFSHKTEFGPSRFGSQPFREIATSWINTSDLNSFFSIEQNIDFFDSIDAKIAAIDSFDPDFYVDDLIKVFTNPGYNSKINSFLYKDVSPEINWLVEINHFSEVEDFLL